MRVRYALLLGAFVIVSLGGAGAQEQRTVRCESNDGRYRRCAVEQAGRVELRRQISGSPCIEKSTWGYDASGIWVDRGCRADFEVFAGPKLVRCDSDDEEFHVCATGPIREARLHRQISGTPCRENYSWGRRADGVWVDRGCRAEFDVWPRASGERPARTSIVRCDSDDEHYHFCSTGALERVELNRQISGTPCRRDVNWGQRGDGIWVDKGCRAEFEVVALRRLIPRTLRCDSADERYHFCSTGPIERAQMNRQISGSPCREGYSWGRRDDGVWVDKGCRAEFEIYSYEDSAVATAAPMPVSDSTQMVSCDSDDGRYRFCMTGPIRSAELTRQTSSAPCRFNYSWGYREDGVWVDKGCRGEFHVQ
jgi:hypothetical protein